MKIKPLIFLIVAVLLLAGLFIAFKPEKSNPVDNQGVVDAPESNAKTFDIVINDRKIVSGNGTLNVTEGDQVVIKITADEAEEFHVHGYDRSVDLEKDKPIELSFRADLTGRFVFELEQSKIELGALEVLPK